jgi:hypothetical protein
LFRWAKKRDHVEAICSALAEEGIECGEEREEKCQKEKAQVRSLVRALDFAADSLDLANGVISAIGVMANAVALVARFVPAARPAGTLLMATHREITLVQQQVRAALEYAKLMARLQGGAVPRELAHLIPG